MAGAARAVRPGAAPGLDGGAHRRPPAHHLHHHPVAVLGGVLLGIADGGAGERHEDVVERRARDADRADRQLELGEQARDELLARGTPKVTAPSLICAPRSRTRCQRRDRGLVVVGMDRDPVLADAGLERLGRVERDDLAVVHDRDPVAPLGLVHVVGGHEDRDLLALLELADVVPDRAARLRIEADRRLVEEQHARRVHQPARDLQPSAHPAGERSHDRVLAIPEPDHLHHLLHPRLDEVGLHAVELGVQLEVLGGGQVAVERRILEHEADVATDVVALGDDVVPGHAAPRRRSAWPACRAC